jgi:hypothetical protein
MTRFAAAATVGLVAAIAVPSAPVPKGPAKPTGVLVLDNCDPASRGKDKYGDTLTLLDGAGKEAFRVAGFNNGETTGCAHAVAADPARKCVWTIENVAHRVRRFDLTGKETLAIEGVNGHSLAVDTETGNVWVSSGNGTINAGKTVVYDDTGKEVASYAIPCYDLAYDRTAKAFWIVAKKLTKITAKGEVLFSTDVSTWCARSVDVDQRSGSAWVAVGLHPQVPGSANELLRFDAEGKEQVRIGFDKKAPFRVSADPKDGGVWVAQFGLAVEKFSADGKSEASHVVEARAVQADPGGDGVWVVTPEEVQRMTAKGEVTKRVKHPAKTSQAWIAALE